MSGLTTHALDLGLGRPAAGLAVELWAREAGGDRLVKRLVTNAEGRTDEPLLAAGEIEAGRYRLVFGLGAYHRGLGGPGGQFEEARIGFVVQRPDEHHHVPLLLSPFGYSTYRGS